jgi:hypothetical protein
MCPVYARECYAKRKKTLSEQYANAGRVNDRATFAVAGTEFEPVRPSMLSYRFTGTGSVGVVSTGAFAEKPKRGDADP